MAADQTLPDIVHDAKLEAEITSTHIQHLVRHGLSPHQRRVKKRERWIRDSIKPILGQGGFGVVYLERCEQKVRAVKEIPKQLVRGEDLDYVRELEAVFKFSHPKYSDWFVRSDGWFESSSSVYISMEYLEHGDLQGFLKRPLPENETKHISFQVLEGLEFMHENNFVHRDLKPGNIMVVTPSPQWFVKIADFGISKRRQEGATSLTTIKRGTIGFCAPEALGVVKGSSWDFAVDMWSLGAVGYRLLTGTTVFDDVMELFRFANGLRSLPTHLKTCGVSSDAQSFIQSLLSPDPKDRLSTNEASRHPWLDASTASPTENHVHSPSDHEAEPENKSLSVSEPSAAWSELDATIEMPARSSITTQSKTPSESSEASAAWSALDTTVEMPPGSSMKALPTRPSESSIALKAPYPTDEFLKRERTRMEKRTIVPESRLKDQISTGSNIVTRIYSTDDRESHPNKLHGKQVPLSTNPGAQSSTASRHTYPSSDTNDSTSSESVEDSFAADYASNWTKSENKIESNYRVDDLRSRTTNAVPEPPMSSMSSNSSASIESQQTSDCEPDVSGTATITIVSARSLLEGDTKDRYFISIRQVVSTDSSYPHKVVGRTQSRLLRGKLIGTSTDFEEVFKYSCMTGTYFMLEVFIEGFVGECSLFGKAPFCIDSSSIGEEQCVTVKSPVAGFKCANVIIRTEFRRVQLHGVSRKNDDAQMRSKTSPSKSQDALGGNPFTIDTDEEAQLASLRDKLKTTGKLSHSSQKKFDELVEKKADLEAIEAERAAEEAEMARLQEKKTSRGRLLIKEQRRLAELIGKLLHLSQEKYDELVEKRAELEAIEAERAAEEAEMARLEEKKTLCGKLLKKEQRRLDELIDKANRRREAKEHEYRFRYGELRVRVISAWGYVTQSLLLSSSPQISILLKYSRRSGLEYKEGGRTKLRKRESGQANIRFNETFTMTHCMGCFDITVYGHSGPSMFDSEKKLGELSYSALEDGTGRGNLKIGSGNVALDVEFTPYARDLPPPSTAQTDATADANASPVYPETEIARLMREFGAEGMLLTADRNKLNQLLSNRDARDAQAAQAALEASEDSETPVIDPEVAEEEAEIAYLESKLAIKGKLSTYLRKRLDELLEKRAARAAAAEEERRREAAEIARLEFYKNRVGRNLPKRREKRLEELLEKRAAAAAARDDTDPEPPQPSAAPSKGGLVNDSRTPEEEEEEAKEAEMAHL